MKTYKKELERIFNKYSDKRICVLGTTCCGKSTLQQSFPDAIDMDNALWPTLTEDEEKYICSKPWTEEIGEFTRKLVRERVVIDAGHPLFSLILLKCDVIVYMNISDEVLARHCEKRNASFKDAKNIKNAIERRIISYRETNEVLYFEVEIDD